MLINLRKKMKKLLCLFGASLLVLTSCSNDNDDNNPANAILIKEINYIDIDGSSEVSKYTYTANKIVSIDEYGGKSNYTYTGDVITKIEGLDENNVIDNLIEYTYANGKVASFVESEPGFAAKYKRLYTYNADGTVSYTTSSINTVTNVEIQGSTGVLTFKDGNLIKEVRTSGTNVNTTTYEYDAEKNPNKNILGFSLLLDNEESVSVNNVVKRTEVSSNTGGSSTYVYTITYTYDANGFPTEGKNFGSDGTADGTAKYTY